MNRTEALVLTSALAVSMTTQLAAQHTNMTVRPESRVTLSGGSNVHDWTCTGSTFQSVIELDPAYLAKPMTEIRNPIRKVTVTIPVKSLKCGKEKMDDNMYKALRADQFPEIRYTLESYELDPARTTADGFTARTVGQLTLAGQVRAIEMPVNALRGADGSMTGEGSVKMKMTDFGIKPPVALLGTLRTKDEVTVSFKVLLNRDVVVAAMKP